MEDFYISAHNQARILQRTHLGYQIQDNQSELLLHDGPAYLKEHTDEYLPDFSVLIQE